MPSRRSRSKLLNLNDVVDRRCLRPLGPTRQCRDDELSGGDGIDIVSGGGDADTINTRGLGPDTALCDATDAVISDHDDAVSAACTNNNVAPVADITGGPNGATNQTSPTFSFTVTNPSETVTGSKPARAMTKCFRRQLAVQETTEFGRPIVFRLRALDYAPSGTLEL